MKLRLPVIFVALISLVEFFGSCCDCRSGLKNNQCLIISDIHLNPFYAADGSFRTDDKLVTLLLRNPKPEQWDSILQKHMAADPFKSLSGKDADYGLLKSAVDSIYGKIPNPAFIVIAGDFLWHGSHGTKSLLDSLKGDSLANLKKSAMNFIAYLFKSKFKNVPIIPVLGNNDTDGGDYDAQSSDFLKSFASSWKLDAPGVNIDSLDQEGYYSYQSDSVQGLEFISLNTTLVSPYQDRFDSTSRGYHIKYTTKGLAMLSWLERKLQSAPNNVWIISHIPPGINEYNAEKLHAGNKSYTDMNWDDTCNSRIGQILSKYKSKVKFYIAGHTHFNEYRVLYGDKQKAAFASIRVVPSLGTSHISNPSFEIASFNGDYNVYAETEYYLDLAKGSRRWEVLQTDQRLRDASPSSIYSVLSSFDSSNPPDVPGYYLNFYFVGAPAALNTGYLRNDVMHVKGE